MLKPLFAFLEDEPIARRLALRNSCSRFSSAGFEDVTKQIAIGGSAVSPQLRQLTILGVDQCAASYCFLLGVPISIIIVLYLLHFI